MIIDPSTIPIAQLQGYLQSAVAPRPIAFASTIDKAGNVNLSPFSFFNVFSANPPILVFSPARRVTNNTTKHTLENVLVVPEVVINIVHFPIVEQASLASTEYERGVDEFVKAGLTAMPSLKVKPPRVGESPVSFECTVEQVIPLGDNGGAGNLVIAKVQLIHIQDQYLDEQGRLDTTRLDLVARMGGNWYARASGAALFEIPKPLSTRGIGVDQLPEHVRQSTILNGNNLGRLGNLEQMPNEELLQQARKLPKVQVALTNSGMKQQTMLHYLAKEQLDLGDTALALAVLMLYEQ
jgi:flavin reductase (DIM6/NTAB) family NADH-FMN oxidoreductase RutF